MTGGARARRPRRRWAALLFLGLAAWWGASPAPANAAGPMAADDCHTERLSEAHTDVELRLENHGRSVAEASGVMKVRVPTSWPYANDLLLSDSSEPHRRAMRCLLRAPGTMSRPEEWRTHSPRVKAEASWVEIQYETQFRFNNGGRFNVGPWVMELHTKQWSLSLTPPPALKGAHWDRVRIDPGGLDASEVTPRPSAAENGQLVWTGVGQSATPGGPMVTVRVIPPWQRAWAATSASSEPWLIANAAGMTTWWVGSSIVMALAALRARRQPAGPELTELEKSSSGALWWWAVLKAVLGVMVLLLYKAILNTAGFVADEPPDWLGYSMRWPVLIGVLGGWLLVVTARPRRSVTVAATLVAAAAALVAAVPSLFGLPEPLATADRPADAGFAVLVAEVAALEWLWLAGVVLWAWTLARQGGLLRPAATPWRLRRLGPALAALTLLLLGWGAWAIERKWQRVSWLSDRGVAAYHTQHVASLARDMASFASQIPAWYYTHTWVLTGIAIVALLRARDLAPTVPYASPTPLDRLLLAVFFAVVVAWRQGSYAGSQALSALWLVFDVAALYGLLAVGQRRAVLTQHLEGCEGCDGSPQLCETITEAERNDLIARARRYRELTATLRTVDQAGGEAALSRHALEKELSRLHRWRPAPGTGGAARPWLPAQVTVVDVALSWGPHAKWWDNARRAAVLAAAFGIPGSILMVWMAYAPTSEWMRRGLYMFGAPEMVWMFVYWELVWAGAGLVLGALWRLLPGRRGPARALGLTLAYALLIGLGILGNLITDQEIGNVAVGVSLMLLVLTLTSLAMDADTFRSERRFWPNRIGLLLSIYQIRSFSAQVAYILMQLVAVLTILKFFAGSDARWK
ncbi:DUF6185 family protein [Streptomyces griseocarneus]|uniref:DUF6185 family protein n=1 Tax=Streptomyces griseocarneus TaxID=51201 RepID=UPI00167D8CE7|nr:DUF6185 family protein [Streptomyces griseocarneus]MBZ6475214.1 DUF6185 family protein [Streptomyces griseocarneus]GHG61618.1 hypothetical protein GCM10018779_29650 [Streptomyces griseocarneus]